MLEIPHGFDSIEIRKQLNDIIRKAQSSSKPEVCFLCGEKKESFCNSHSVPQMVLKNIAEKGKLLQVNAMMEIEVLDVEKGVNNSGTFRCICNECDSKFFKDYENFESIKSKPTDIMLAEIALKDSLLELSKRNQECELYKLIPGGEEIINKVISLDIEEYSKEIQLYKNIIINNEKNQFDVLFWNHLPYKVPYATETCFALSNDMEGNIINDNFNFSPKTRMEKIHICVFPLKTESVVFAFSHKNNIKYSGLKRQIQSISNEQALGYINWLVIKDTENIFIAKDMESILRNNQNLKKLSQEVFGFPNLGIIDSEINWEEYRPVDINDIPNLLDAKYAIEQ